MKYNALSKVKRKRYQMPLLDGGINTYLDPASISENHTSASDNMWFNGGMLRSRPGVSAKENVVPLSNAYTVRLGLNFTDVTVNKGSDRYQLAYSVVTDHMTKEELRTYLVENNGNMISIETLMFSRMSEDEFFRYNNVFFVSGNKTKSSGIYAFLTKYCMTYGYSYHIYELSLDKLRWEELAESDYYVPVTYMYGRGNNYEKAVEIGRAVEEKTVYPEGYNMLSGYFRAYFSSDEYSDQFVLPEKNLREDAVVECRIYYNPYSYAYWRIPSNADSAESTIYSATVTMHCDRKNGIISFKGADDKEYQVPRMKNARANNIVITACRNADMKQRVMLNRWAKAYNTRLFLCSNDVYKNEVCSSPINNPLYFAEDMKTAVGKYGSKVVALQVQQNKLIAFKEDEIYKINVTDKGSYSMQTLYDGSYDFLENERLTTTPIHPEIGCAAPNSIALCGNKLVWVGKGGKIYTLITTTYGKENNVYEVSLPINTLTQNFTPSQISDAFGTEYNGYYIVSINNNVFLMDYKIRNFGISTTFTGLKDTASSISWYRWSFPDTVSFTSFFKSEKNLLVSCKTYPVKAYYIAALVGSADTLYETDGETLKEYPVEAYFVTGDIPKGNEEYHKNIDEVYIECSNKSHINLEMSDGKTSFSYRLRAQEEVDLIRVNPRIRHTKSVKLKMSSNKEFAVGKIIVSYHNVSKVR